MYVDLDGRIPIVGTSNLSFAFFPPIIGPAIPGSGFNAYIEKAEEIYNKQREEVPAPQLSYPTDISDLPDYTEIIDEWMDEKMDMFQKMQEGGEVDLPVHWGHVELGVKLSNDIEILIEFYNQVKTTGDMDIKKDESWDKAFGFSRPEYFIYHGEVMDPGTMGNIAYGYVGASLYPDLILYMGGGAVNMKRLDIRYVLASPMLPYYGDSPEDHEAIKKGIEMWLERSSCEN